MNAALNRVKTGYSHYLPDHCPHCDGTGRKPDWKRIGMAWKLSRIERGVKLIDVAKSLGKSPSFISMLEKGRKPWPPRMEFRYLAALKALR